MGGIDKGLVMHANKPLIQHAIERLSPQVDEIMINANREIVSYQSFHFPVLQDEYADFIGPLAGICLGLQHAKYSYLLTAPCDSPQLPINLSIKLLSAIESTGADIAVAKSNGKTHPVFSLCKTSVLPSLATFIAQGERKVSAWQKSNRYTEVEFDDDHAFANINTFEDLAALTLK
jgi:molybdopterin-guanine dinucleotide biosynthesis protein A